VVVIDNTPDPGAMLNNPPPSAPPGVPTPPRSFFANLFKILPLWGVRETAPYFHDNSAKTLEDVAAHYTRFFAFVTDFDGPGPLPPLITLTPEDEADMVAFMKLLH